MGEWRETTLGELVEGSGGSIQTGPFGSALHASDYVEFGVPSVMPANIGDNVIVEEGIARITEADARRLGRHLLEVGDIVYSRRGDVERRAFVREENSGWLCGTGCLRVHFGSHEGVDPQYVSYALGTEWTREWIVQNAVGATMLNLNTGILSRVPLVAPPVDEQRAIAEVLGALDDKIAANTRLAATAASLAQTLYGDGVRGLPRVAMSSVLVPVLGGTPARSRGEFWGGDELWISAKDVTGAPHQVVLDTEQKITELAVQQTKAKPLPRGSVILTARGTVGAVARLNRPASFNQSCYGFEPVALPPAVLYFAILAATDQAKAIAHGSVFDTITMKTFDHLTVPEFRAGEAAALEVRLAPLLETVETAVVENRRLASIRDTLLPHLMSGKLRVREAVEMAGL